MSIVSSTYSKIYYRNLKEDCATEVFTTELSYKQMMTTTPNCVATLSDFWGNIASRFAKIGDYRCIRKAIKIAAFVDNSNNSGPLTALYSIIHPQLYRFTNEEISALISDCRFSTQAQVCDCISRKFILEMVRRKAPGFFSREWLSVTKHPSLYRLNPRFYVSLAIERAKNHDSTSLEEAIGLAKCLTHYDRQEAFEGIILEKFRLSNRNSFSEPLLIASIAEATDWITLFRHIPDCKKLLPQILAERAVKGDPKAVETAVHRASKIEDSSLRNEAYWRIAVEYAKQPGGDASLAALKIAQLIPQDYYISIYRTLTATFIEKKDRQSFILARQIPKQIERKEYQDWPLHDFIKGLAGRATNSAWAGSLIKLTRKLHSSDVKKETLKEIGKQIARNCDDETGQVIDKIARSLKTDEEISYLPEIAVTVVTELAKKKIKPIPTVLSLATSKLKGENRDTVLQEIAIQSAKRSSSSEEAMAIATSIESESVKAEAYCGIAIAELNVDSPDAPARAFKTAQLITEFIPRAFTLLMIEMKCDEKLR